MSTHQRLHNKVQRLPRGKPLPLATFEDCGTPTSVRQAVSRLAKSGELVRVARGVYARPKPVPRLKNAGLPTADAIAQVIAKQNHEQLAPHGADLARQLGLSTQMTMQNAFYTTGSTRKVPLRHGTIALQHAPSYLVARQHTPAGRALLALHHLGPRFVTTDVLRRVGERVPSEAFGRMNKRRLPRWLRHAVTVLETPNGG